VWVEVVAAGPATDPKRSAKWHDGMTRGEAFDLIGRILDGTDGPA
jgi:hypothetical protein